MGSRSMKNRPAAKKKHPSTGVLAVLGVFAVVLMAGGIAAFSLFSSWTSNLPDIEKLDGLDASKPSVLYASDGTTVLARFQLKNRTPVSGVQIGSHVRSGTVATEDERFFDHKGVDLAGIARATLNNLTGGQLEGASTITQQLVRNTVLADEMDEISLRRKVREAVLSMQIEQRYSKNDILVMYLNTINYGSGAYGIEAASKRYFSKSANELSVAESALLIGIPQSPTYNNPIDYPDNALARRNLVLSRMLKNDVITQGEYDQAVAEPLQLNETPPADEVLAYPYFTTYVRSLLTSEYGISESDLMEGGLTVTTTIDPALQGVAEQAAAAKVRQVGQPFDVAMTVVEPSTGYIRALVGGSDYAKSQINLATGQGASGRPSGSAFKVFTLAAAIEEGISPQTLVDCSSPATVDGYTLQNYDNINYGTRSLSRALAVSSNTGFVRLTASIGANKVADMAKRLGVSSKLDVGKTGIALTLGTENVTPLEMTQAYATIATQGTRVETTPIMTVADANGRIIVDNGDASKRSSQVLSKDTAYALEQAMEGVVNTYEGTGQQARLQNGQVVAGKTGTTEQYHDVSFYGFTPQYAVGVWCGDPSNQATLTPGTNVADVFSAFMNAALKGKQPVPFVKQPVPAYKPYADEKYRLYAASAAQSPGVDAGAQNNATDADARGGAAGGANGALGTGNAPNGSNGANDAGTGGTQPGAPPANGGAGAGGQGAGTGGASGGASPGGRPPGSPGTP
ncbi:penicillin-binding protein [Eggerthellaceae bacterium zg-997]|nr:penicillin-binding protein [Eggerthellaceae bacterium zg-997]